MPVLDHAIHPMTQFGDDYRYGCHSTRKPGPVSAGYWTQERQYGSDGRFFLIDRYVKNVMSKLCRYDMRAGDLNCRDCRHDSDVAYLKGYGL